MLVRVELVGPSDAPASSVEIECGAGEQILRWIGYTACARLAMDESNLMGIYVPKSISDKHGTLLDPNFVVNEVVKDQQTLVVEFGSGPEAFSAHLAPDTPEEATGPNAPSAGHAHGQEAPPSSWSQAGWLESMDLSLYGMQEFISKEIIQSKPEMVTKDLDATKEILLQYGGIIQLFFFYYATIDSSTSATSTSSMKMNLASFRNFCLDCHTTTDNFKVKKIDSVYERAMADKATVTTVNTAAGAINEGAAAEAPAAAATSEAGDVAPPEDGGAESKGSGDATRSAAGIPVDAPQLSVMTMGMREFFIALVTLAGLKFEMGVENPTWGYAELSHKLSHLLSDYVLPSLVPSFDERMAMLDTAILNPQIREVCERGRKLTRTSMDRCLLTRAQTQVQRIEFKQLWSHMSSWTAIAGKIDFCSVIQVYCWAKMCAAYGRRAIKDAIESITHLPLYNGNFDFDYDEYELFLVGLASRLYYSENNPAAPIAANGAGVGGVGEDEPAAESAGSAEKAAGASSDIAEFTAKFLNEIYKDCSIVENGSIDDEDNDEAKQEESAPLRLAKS